MKRRTGHKEKHYESKEKAIPKGLVCAKPNLYFVAVISYCSVIAPQSLIATAISIVSVLTWIVGQGVGAILAGVIIEKYNMRVMFVVFGIAGSSFFFAYWILYHLVIKRYEVNQNKTNEMNTQESSEQTKVKEDSSEINLTARMVSSRL